jgi:hypothetical protein
LHGLRTSLKLFEVQEISEIVYKNNLRGLDSNLTVDYAVEVVGGDNTLELTVENNTDGGLVTVNGIETINIRAVGENVFDLTALDAKAELGAKAEVNISGDDNVELDLLALDAVTVKNSAAGIVILEATLATSVINSGTGSMTLTDVADGATVTNSGSGELSFDVAAADAATITNSGSEKLTVVTVGDDATITNSGAGELFVEATGKASEPGKDVTITNSGSDGATTINASLATVISVSAGSLTVKEDAFAADAKITATGTGNVTVTVKDTDAEINASASTGTRAPATSWF